MGENCRHTDSASVQLTIVSLQITKHKTNVNIVSFRLLVIGDFGAVTLGLLQSGIRSIPVMGVNVPIFQFDMSPNVLHIALNFFHI